MTGALAATNDNAKLHEATFGGWHWQEMSGTGWWHWSPRWSRQKPWFLTETLPHQRLSRQSMNAMTGQLEAEVSRGSIAAQPQHTFSVRGWNLRNYISECFLNLNTTVLNGRWKAFAPTRDGPRFGSQYTKTCFENGRWRFRLSRTVSIICVHNTTQPSPWWW